jgi:hypothetical protein
LSEPYRITVQNLKGAFAGESQAEVALVVEHPYERARTVLTPATQSSLAGDLEETRVGT